MKKTIAILIILLLFSIIIIPSTVGIIDKTKTITIPGFRGYIQDLIDDASPGDTIYIPSGTYYENIVINKPISLIGEDRDTTIIDGGESGTVVSIFSDGVNLEGFTVQNSGDGSYGYYAGICIQSNFNTIKNNTISNNRDGILLFDFYSNNNITSNIISNNEWNAIVFCAFNNYNTITYNTISNHIFGINIGQFCDYNTITDNSISNNKFGITIDEISDSNIIYHNNFINNEENAKDRNINIWDDGKYGNYWSDYKERYPNAKKILDKGIWDTPYEILDFGDSWDNCPLIKQWPDSVSIDISKNKALNNPLLNWLKSHPNMLPLIQQLLWSISL